MPEEQPTTSNETPSESETQAADNNYHEQEVTAVETGNDPYTVQNPERTTTTTEVVDVGEPGPLVPNPTPGIATIPDAEPPGFETATTIPQINVEVNDRGEVTDSQIQGENQQETEAVVGQRDTLAETDGSAIDPITGAVLGGALMAAGAAAAAFGGKKESDKEIVSQAAQSAKQIVDKPLDTK